MQHHAAAALEVPDRLVDYLVVVREGEPGAEGEPGVSERYPAENHAGAPMPPQVSMFCLPDADHIDSECRSDSDTESTATESDRTATVPEDMLNAALELRRTRSLSSTSSREHPATASGSRRSRADTPASASVKSSVSRADGVLSAARQRSLGLRPYTGPHPEFFVFVLTAATGQRSFGSCISYYEPILADPDDPFAAAAGSDAESDDESPTSQGRRPRLNGRRAVICLLSHWPFLSLFRDFLTELYSSYIAPSRPPRGAGEQYRLPLERYVCAFVSEAPLPHPHSRVEYPLLAANLTCTRPALQSLPLLDPMPMAVLFSCLSAENVVQAMSFLLTEQRVVLYSEHKARLAAAAEGLSALLFPFCWQHIYIPVLPRKLLEYAQAPVPFLVGVDTGCLARVEIVNALPSSAVVDLDNNNVISPMDDTAVGNQSEGAVPALPASIRRTVERRLRAVAPPPRPLEPTEPEPPVEYDAEDRSVAGPTARVLRGSAELDNSAISKDLRHAAFGSAAHRAIGRSGSHGSTRSLEADTSSSGVPIVLSASAPADFGGTPGKDKSRTAAGDDVAETPRTVAGGAGGADASDRSPVPSIVSPAGTEPASSGDVGPWDWIGDVRVTFLEAFFCLLDWHTLLEGTAADDDALDAIVRDSPPSHKRFIAPFVETLVFQSFWGDALVDEPDDEVRLFRHAHRVWLECKQSTGHGSPAVQRKRGKDSRVSRFLRFGRSKAHAGVDADTAEALPLFDEAHERVKEVVLGRERHVQTSRMLLPAAFGVMPEAPPGTPREPKADSGGDNGAVAASNSAGEATAEESKPQSADGLGARDAGTSSSAQAVQQVATLPHFPRLQTAMFPSRPTHRRDRGSSTSSVDTDGLIRNAHRRASSGQITSLVMQARMQDTLGRLMESASPAVRSRAATESFGSSDDARGSPRLRPPLASPPSIAAAARLAAERDGADSFDEASARSTVSDDSDPAPTASAGVAMGSAAEQRRSPKSAAGEDSGATGAVSRATTAPGVPPTGRRHGGVGFGPASMDVRALEAHRQRATMQAAALSAARKEGAMLRSRLEDSESQRVELVAELNEARTLLSTLEADVEQKRSTIQQLESVDMPRLNRELASEKTRADTLHTRLKAAMNDIRELRTRVGDTEKELMRSQSFAVELMGELDSVRKPGSAGARLMAVSRGDTRRASGSQQRSQRTLTRSKSARTSLTSRSGAPPRHGSGPTAPRELSVAVGSTGASVDSPVLSSVDSPVEPVEAVDELTFGFADNARPRSGSGTSDSKSATPTGEAALRHRIRMMGERLDHERAQRERLFNMLQELKKEVRAVVPAGVARMSLARAHAGDVDGGGATDPSGRAVVELRTASGELYSRIRDRPKAISEELGLLGQKLKSLANTAAKRDAQLRTIMDAQAELLSIDRATAAVLPTAPNGGSPSSAAAETAPVSSGRSPHADKQQRIAGVGVAGGVVVGAASAPPPSKHARVRGYTQRHSWQSTRRLRDEAGGSERGTTSTGAAATASSPRATEWTPADAEDALLASTTATLFLEATAHYESLLLLVHRLEALDRVLAIRVGRRLEGRAAQATAELDKARGAATSAAAAAVLSSGDVSDSGDSEGSSTEHEGSSGEEDDEAPHMLLDARDAQALRARQRARVAVPPTSPSTPRRGLRHVASFTAREQAGNTEIVARNAVPRTADGARADGLTGRPRTSSTASSSSLSPTMGPARARMVSDADTATGESSTGRAAVPGRKRQVRAGASPAAEGAAGRGRARIGQPTSAGSKHHGTPARGRGKRPVTVTPGSARAPRVSSYAERAQQRRAIGSKTAAAHGAPGADGISR